MTETVRNVLVTGASRGLGLAIARKLSSVGYRVIAVARSKSKEITEAIAEAKSGHQAPLHFAPFDLGEIEQIPELVKTLRREFGPLYGLVNNAAVGHDGALAMMHNAKIEQLVRLNTLSPIVLTKYVVALDDVGRHWTHRQCRIHHWLHWLQRAFRLRGHQGVHDRLHPFAGARGRPARHQRQRGGARISRYRHDARACRRAAGTRRAPQLPAPSGKLAGSI